MKNCRTYTRLNSSRCSLLLLLLFGCLGVMMAQEDSKQWRDSVRYRLDSLLMDDMFDQSQVGVCIYDLTDDVPLFRHHERQTLRPASTQKIITAITALDVLGDSYRLTTAVKYDGVIEGRSLKGDVYCIGGFDPLFDSNDLLLLAHEIKEQGIDSISGNIFIDKSLKDNTELGEGWCWDDENPQLSALTVDEKDEFALRFTEALENEGVYVSAQMGFNTCPKDAKYLCSTYHTVAEVLPKMLKESDNFYAEALFYNIAAFSGKKWASAHDAANIISGIAKMLGHEKSEYRIADGSGLSLYNYTTASIETSFLRFAYNNRDIYAPLYLNLPIAGVDGTLKRRMKQYPNTYANVRAKTGSVSCVSSLSGYCKAYNGNMIAFCIINQGNLRSKKARAFQDKVCAILCEPVNTQLINT